ncbi:MAG TPA: phytoene/squalene synthase family protein [Terriglobales bacterium]|nr:phytoene/squalene synthase family protein [Terriglobales bacterium]
MSAGVQSAPAPFSPSRSQLAVAYSVCSGIARAAAKNFYYAFLVLPRPKRQALCSVYAFMRRCDDITDDPRLSLEERRRKLAEWLDGVHKALAGNPTDDPVLLALTDTQRRYKIPAMLLDQLAEGTAMDVQEELQQDSPRTPRPQVPRVPYRTFEDLRVYCYHVASVVGLVCIRIFGYRDPAAEPLAEQLGLAFQLTNIIRDVKEDASLGRIYLPEDDLIQFDVSPAELASAAGSARLRLLLAFEADRAREFYRAGEQLLPLVEEDSQPALWVLLSIYRRLLEKIAGRQFDVYREKIHLSAFEKLVILGKGWRNRLT